MRGPAATIGYELPAIGPSALHAPSARRLGNVKVSSSATKKIGGQPCHPVGQGPASRHAVSISSGAAVRRGD
jgi:hypothetical protein